MAAVRGNGFVHDFPGRMKRKDGRIIDISISTNALRDEQGQYAGVEGIWRDITQRKEMERELERLATRDDLTGLANRRHILDALERAFKRREGRHDAMPFCALIMDLDHFKRINDTYGHVAGDAVLRGVARIVEALSRAGDQIGRLGGEEFLLLLEGADLAAAREAAERIRSAVQAASIEVAPGLQVSQTLSIGISCWMHADGQSTDMLERADRALYRAKAQWRWYATARVCSQLAIFKALQIQRLHAYHPLSVQAYSPPIAQALYETLGDGHIELPLGRCCEVVILPP